MLLQWNKKSSFTQYTESVRTLLLLTLEGAVSGSKVGVAAAHHGVSQVSSVEPITCNMLCASDTPVYPSIDSHPTGSRHLHATSRKKKARKRVHILTDIPDDHKTAEFKAFEAFLIAHQQLDDLDLNGGEDPTLLHNIITSHHSFVAYKEVSKFKRRPQYLEMLVHLLHSTLNKGHQDRVLEWVSEGFQWLSRRNEVLLNPRVTQRITGEDVLLGKGKTAKGSHLFSTVPSKVNLKKTHRGGQTGQTGQIGLPGVASIVMKPRDHAMKDHGSREHTPKEHVSRNVSRDHVSRDHTPTLDHASPRDHARGEEWSRDHLNSPTERPMGTKAKKHSHTGVSTSTLARRDAISARRYTIRKSLQPSTAAELSQQIRITREDLEAKSASVLITKLPELWRNHKCRCVQMVA